MRRKYTELSHSPKTSMGCAGVGGPVMGDSGVHSVVVERPVARRSFVVRWDGVIRIENVGMK